MIIEFMFGVMKKIWKKSVVMVAKICQFNQCQWLVHLKMVKMANIM